MKKKTVSLSWPASLSGFVQDKVQENFTRGKLSVFYKGETSDHRFFSDTFAEEVVKTLPYTPVVSYYDEEKDDFVGHATEQQILGIVDPCAEPVFEKLEDGNVWAICDVVLYTERPDKVGTIAKKIEGHSQSLELNPNTVKYVVNYDEKKHFKNIEFTAGDFVGVSVLGKDQKPAFTGSAFFSCDKQFEEKMNLLKNYCESGHKDGGESMNVQDFITASWGEISSKVNEAVQLEYQEYYTYMVDMYNDCGVFRFYSLIDGTSKLMKVFYSIGEDGAVKISNIKEVRVDYVDVEVQPVETAEMAVEEEGVSHVVEDCAQKEEDSKKPEEEPKDPEKEPKKEEEEEGKCEASDVPNELSEEDKKEEPKDDEDAEPSSDEDKEDDEKKKADCNAASEVNAELTQSEVKEVSECENEDSAKDQSSTSSFSESERAELEGLKKEKKVGILNSFKDSISEEDFNNIESRLDDFSEESLELELLRSFKKENEAPKKQRFFSFVEPEKTNEDSLDSLVSKYMSRRG